jgi:hypothetical protein
VHSDLLDVQSWPPSLIQIFQTSVGTNSPTHPPNVLSIEGVWEHVHDGVSGVNSVSKVSDVRGVDVARSVSDVSSVRKGINIRVGRPCRLFCNPGIVEGCLKAATDIMEGNSKSGPAEACENSEDGTIATCSDNLDTPRASEGGYEPPREVLGSATEILFSTAQVVLEFLVPPSQPVGVAVTPPVTPALPQRPLVVSWEGLDLSLAGWKCNTKCSRLQLFSEGEEGKHYIVLPTTLECVVNQHLASSSIDM